MDRMSSEETKGERMSGRHIGKAGHQTFVEGGFSLIELLVVVVILGVLIAIALPSLTGSRRAVGEQAVKVRLLDLAARQEAFRTSLGRRRYATDNSNTELGVTLPGGKKLVNSSDFTVEGWTIAPTFDTQGKMGETFGFTATATGESRQYCVFQDGELRSGDGECKPDSPIVGGS